MLAEAKCVQQERKRRKEGRRRGEAGEVGLVAGRGGGPQREMEDT